MKSITLFISFFLFAIILNSCGPENKVEVNSFTPTGEVEKLTNFVIEFSEDLAPPDVQDKWLDEEFISFTPPIPGKFKWASGNTLVFSPSVPLDPIQNYSAWINKNVLFNKNFAPVFD